MRWAVAFAVLVSAQSACAATAEELRAALADGSRYAMTTALDEHGMARGDYDLAEGRWEPYEPAWHTGQLILGLVDSYRITKDPAALAAARRAGEWWLAQEIKDHPKLSGMLNAWHGGRLGPLINFTTVTNGTKGLFQLSKETGDRRYADAAVRSIRWLVRHTEVAGETLFYNIIDPKTGEVWTDKSPHHPNANPASLTQVARPNIEGSPFADVCDWTGDKKMCALQMRIAEGLLARQSDNGLWMAFEPNDPDTGKIHPRFNIWNAEALIRTYDITKDKRYLEGAVKAMRAMAKLQRPDGTIYYDNFTDGRFREGSFTGSASSFAGHIWLKLRQRGVGDEFTPHIERSLSWVLKNRFPWTHPDKNLAGSFMDTRVRMMRSGDASLINRGDIATSFGLRFLAAYYRDSVKP
jgi:rhamnogalacturonyl hydrolase YesR